MWFTNYLLCALIIGSLWPYDRNSFTLCVGKDELLIKIQYKDTSTSAHIIYTPLALEIDK